MAQAMHIDTLEAAKTLKDAGLDDKQAEAIVHVFQNADTSKLATKEDIAELRTEIKDLDVKIDAVNADLTNEIKDLDVKIDAVNADLTNEIKDVRKDLTHGFATVEQRIENATNRAVNRLGVVIVTAAGFIVAVDKLF